jgi:membrane protease YdiL (CAAX protease family)
VIDLLNIVIIMLLLLLFYHLKDREYVDSSSIFKDLKWDLAAAYKVYIPFLLLLFFSDKLFNTPQSFWHKLSPEIVSVIAYIEGIIILSLFLSLFVLIIKRPFQIQWDNFGINRKCFIYKAMPILFFAGLIFVTLIYTRGINNTIFAHAQVSIISIISFILIMGFNAITEELLFRGVLWGAFTKKMSISMAALASSACFALGHYNLPLIRIYSIILIGLFLSWSYIKSKTILVPMAIHFSLDIIIPLINKHF